METNGCLMSAFVAKIQLNGLWSRLLGMHLHHFEEIVFIEAICCVEFLHYPEIRNEAVPLVKVFMSTLLISPPNFTLTEPSCINGLHIMQTIPWGGLSHRHDPASSPDAEAH